MGIHIHTKGRPDMCRCCAIVDRLNELWDRTHNSVLSVNGVYADGNGNVFIQGIQDISDLREEVQTLEERVTNDRTYLEAVAEDVAEIGTLVPSLATLNTEQTFTAAKYLSVIGANATAIVNKDWIWKTDANADNGLLHREGSEVKNGDLTIRDHILYMRDYDVTWSSGGTIGGMRSIAYMDSTNRQIAVLFPRVFNGRAVMTMKLINADGSYRYENIVGQA